jgi:hypothetical protein
LYLHLCKNYFIKYTNRRKKGWLFKYLRSIYLEKRSSSSSLIDKENFTKTSADLEPQNQTLNPPNYTKLQEKKMTVFLRPIQLLAHSWHKPKITGKTLN